jgi:hypothetical protein
MAVRPDAAHSIYETVTPRSRPAKFGQVLRRLQSAATVRL